ncbi:hypothetical protein JCM8208_007827 [Rhodotorula glutinis]
MQHRAGIVEPRAGSDQRDADKARASSTSRSSATDSFLAALYPGRASSSRAAAPTTSSSLEHNLSPAANASRLPRLSRLPPRLPPVAGPTPPPTRPAIPSPITAAPDPTLSSSSTASASSSTRPPAHAARPPPIVASSTSAPRRPSTEPASTSSAGHGRAPSRAVGRGRLFALSLDEVAKQSGPKAFTVVSGGLEGGEDHVRGAHESLSTTSVEREGGSVAPCAARAGQGRSSVGAGSPHETSTSVDMSSSIAQLAPAPSRPTSNGGPTALEQTALSLAAPPVLLSIKGASRAEPSIDIGPHRKRERSPSPSSPPVKRLRVAPAQPLLPALCPWAQSSQGQRRTWNDPLSMDQIDPRWNDCTFADFAPFLHDEHVEPALFDGFYEEQIEFLRACAPVTDWHPDPTRLSARMARLPQLADQVGARQPRRSAIRAAVGPLRSALGYNELDNQSKRVWKWLGRVVGWVWLGGGSASPDEVSHVARTAPKPVMLIFRHLAHILSLRELVDRAYEQLKAHLDRRRRSFTSTAREAAALVLVEWLSRTGPASPQVDRRALFFGRADGRIRRDEGERPWCSRADLDSSDEQ